MRKSMKKRIAFMTLLTLLAVWTACGNAKEDAEPKDEQEKTQESVTEQTEAETQVQETAEASVEETSEEAVPEEPEGYYSEQAARALARDNEIPENEGTALVREMKIGWNLGNTFDAIDCNWLSDEMAYESAWNGAMTTKEQIKTLKEAGFRTVRIPVSWHNHLQDKKDYTISPQWLDRVNEVVDYCVEEDMYVILNIHHDNNEDYMYPDNKHLDNSLKYVTSIWKQLSERFQDYDEHLIFASVNEPRLVGHPNEWWIDPENEDCKEAIACINKINQAFVDTVRASGGNNATRFLICPGYDASPDGALNEGFVFPTDPVDNDHHIILSVHAYSPYSFALESPGVDTWSSKNTKDVQNLVGFMNDVYDKYVSKGVPVLIDEFGAMNKGGNTDARVDFASYYVAAARSRGMSCIWWDNNAHEGDGELFGILDRATCEWVYPEIVEAMMQYCERWEGNRDAEVVG